MIDVLNLFPPVLLDIVLDYLITGDLFYEMMTSDLRYLIKDPRTMAERILVSPTFNLSQVNLVKCSALNRDLVCQVIQSHLKDKVNVDMSEIVYDGTSCPTDDNFNRYLDHVKLRYEFWYGRRKHGLRISTKKLVQYL